MGKQSWGQRGFWGVLGVMLLSVWGLGGCSSLTGLYFHPQQQWVRTPADLGLVYDDVQLTPHDGVMLHAWWLPEQSKHLKQVQVKQEAQETNGVALPPKAESPVVLFLHGNAENVSTHMMSVAWLPRKGIPVLALDYRGFGHSQGHPKLPSVLYDIQAAMDWLEQEMPGRPVVVFGQSIGAALAISYAGSDAGLSSEIAAVVAEAPFDGFGDIARTHMSRSVIGWLVWPFTWLLPSSWDPQAAAGRIRVPVLILHSQDDRVIPQASGRRVYDALRSERCWISLKGRHISAMGQPQARESVATFIHQSGCSAFTNASDLATMPRLNLSGGRVDTCQTCGAGH